MKTNQIMIRRMGPFAVEQRTKDAYFNATSLLKQWNEVTGSKKEIKDYLSNKATKELIATIENRENLNGDNSPYLGTRGKNGGSWMHPVLFMDYAMWINASFKYDVIKFVYDQMIEYRNKSGDAYKELAAAISTITPKHLMQDVMRKIGTSINIIIKGKHEKNLRNRYGDEQSQIEYMELEKKLAMLINEGFIKSLSDLGGYLRKQMGDKLPKL